MLPTAHVATALAFNRVVGLRADDTAAILGALVPDAIDKTLAWVLGVAPTARHIAHTPLAVAALSLGASAVMGPRWGRAFGSAYAVHLVGDLWHGGHIPWLMPFKHYEQRGERWRVEFGRDVLLLEVLGLAAIGLMLRSSGEPA